MTRALAVAISVVCLALTGYHKPKADATLTISATSVAAGVGFSWGTGTLVYKGKSYDVSVDGVTVGAVGVTSITARGSVYHLAKLEDVEGNYTGAGAGGTAGVGGGGVAMQNQNGVEIRLKATTAGVSLTLGSTGVTLKFKKKGE